MTKNILALIMITCLSIGCSNNGEEDSNGDFPNTILARTFQINTPEGWELVEDQGIDTYIGRIKNDNLTIFFDQGLLSFGRLEDVEETSETIYFRRLTIKGVPAIVHKENRTDADTRLSVYLDNGEEQNRLYILDSDNDDFFIAMFKTHKFL
ncbi:hypothetical protein [Flagellimonas onchidii]|uniref:hypothetical protein n=1 Tax=Flagellimonas onchidii TaxID=2562684 RepID=UPI0010A6125F|nr:hypothetical protein [Allomuricauda onchidii]